MSSVTHRRGPSRHRPQAIVVDRHACLSDALSPALSSARPFLASSEYEQVHDLSPGFPPGTTRPRATQGRAGERVSNPTIASSGLLEAPHHRRRSLHPNFRSPVQRLDALASREPPHWMYRSGPFEMARAVAPVLSFWGAYTLDLLMRAPTHHWGLATGSTVLIASGAMAQWHSLIEASSKKTQQRLGFVPPGRGPSIYSKAFAIAAPVAETISVTAYCRGRYLANNPLYQGGLWGSVFSVALGHYASAQLLERLPAWQPLGGNPQQAEGARITSLVAFLSVGALAGVMQAGLQWELWQFLLAASLLVTTASFCSLKDYRQAIGHQAMATTSWSGRHTAIQLSPRPHSIASSGADHFLVQTRMPALPDEEQHSEGEPSATGVAI